jgi:hypothetical protein
MQAALFFFGRRAKRIIGGRHGMIVARNFSERCLAVSLVSASSACTRRPAIFFLQALHELVRLLLGDFLGDAVVFLNFSHELLAFSVDHIEIVIRELAPLFFDTPFRLFPLALNLVPVHMASV